MTKPEKTKDVTCSALERPEFTGFLRAVFYGVAYFLRLLKPRVKVLHENRMYQGNLFEVLVKAYDSMYYKCEI